MADKLPYMPDVQAYLAITGGRLPPKFGNKGPALNDSILMTMRVMDEQDAIRSIEWTGLPLETPNSLIERILYYRANLMMFWMKENNRFYCLPYAGKEIDVYGRYRYATALPFTGSAEQKGKKDITIPWIKDKYWKIIYEPVLLEDWDESMMEDCCVLLSDYTRQLSQKVIPRAQLQEPLLQVESELIPFMRTALLNGTGIEGMKIDSPDMAEEVVNASNQLVTASLMGQRWIPMASGVTSEVLSHSQGAKTEEFLLALQSLDNLRLSFHGLENGGLFQKKAHMLESEQMGNTGNAGLVMADKVQNRQEFCNIVNSIWGTAIWADSSEIVSEVDRNMDGEMDNDDSEIGNDTTAMEGGSEE